MIDKPNNVDKIVIPFGQLKINMIIYLFQEYDFLEKSWQKYLSEYDTKNGVKKIKSRLDFLVKNCEAIINTKGYTKYYILHLK